MYDLTNDLEKLMVKEDVYDDVILLLYLISR